MVFPCGPYTLAVCMNFLLYSERLIWENYIYDDGFDNQYDDNDVDDDFTII